MATEANTATQTAADSKAKVKDVLNDMDARRVLANPDEAIAYIGASIEQFPDFTNYPVAAAGVSEDEDGNLVFDPEVYTDSTNVMVAVLTQRGDGPGTSTVKAIVIAPVPTLDSLLANEAAKAWLTKIVHKELNHVAAR